MKQRTLDEMISYFDQQVLKMDIKHEDKIKLLGMITAIGYKVQKHEWIPCSERLPEEDGEYLCCYGNRIHIGQMINGHFRHYGEIADHLITAWMPLPEVYGG